MWLNKLFIEEPIDFEKRCRSRVLISAVIMVIGAATWGISLYYGIHVPEEARNSPWISTRPWARP